MELTLNNIHSDGLLALFKLKILRAGVVTFFGVSSGMSVTETGSVTGTLKWCYYITVAMQYTVGSLQPMVCHLIHDATVSECAKYLLQHLFFSAAGIEVLWLCMFQGVFYALFSIWLVLSVLMTYEKQYLLISVLKVLYFTREPVVPHAKYSTSK